MMAGNQDLGSVREVDNGYELRFERHFEQPVEEVWQAITDPEYLADWIGPAQVDLRPGGRIRIDDAGGAGIDGEVLEVKEPAVFAFKWDSKEWGDGGPVRFELSEDDGGTLLIFTHVAPAAGFDEFGTKTLAGWHYLLALLGSAVAGNARRFVMAEWEGVHIRYAGSPVPAATRSLAVATYK
jgi:uncharacterized protein YndB with AHSA1/START domain